MDTGNSASRAPTGWQKTSGPVSDRAYFSADGETVTADRPAFARALAAWAQDEAVTELILEDHALTLQVERKGLLAEDAVPWLHQAAEAVTALDGPVQRAVSSGLSPHEQGAGHGGSPVGVIAV